MDRGRPARIFTSDAGESPAVHEGNAVTDELDLPPGAFDRIDESADEDFYEPARLVYHIDDHAVSALTDFYRTVLPVGGAVLDLMSSWVSHLPPEIEYGEVIGHGMNEEELAANPRFTRYFTQNLNANPTLPLADDSLDAATICVSIQYLQQPVAVLTELRRALRPGAPLVISFSNRCFWTKAVAIWRALDDSGHAKLAETYLKAAGFTDTAAHRLAVYIEDEQDPMYAVVGRA